MKNKFIMGLLALIFLVGCSKPKIKVLVFSKTEAFRHQSIEAGITAIKKMAEEKGFEADFTEDASLFTEKNLGKYNAVIFLNTTGDILNNQQQESFERYIQAGGGFVGIHSATDTEYDWPWYGELVGAYFLDHPNDPSNVQKGKFTVLEKGHWATEGMPDTFERADEFYNFKDIKKHINPVLSIDEKSYIGGKNPDFHPMSWYHEFDGGRAFYTALGHTDESYSDPLFLNHVWAGIKYAAGGDKIKPVDFSKSRPEENRFTKVVLADKLDEPMELTVLDDDRVLFIQRKGELMLYDNKTGKVTEVTKIPTSTKYVNKEGKESEAEDGLLGLNKDPNFAKNNWIYIYYSLPEKSVNALVRYEFKDNKLVESSKKIILEVAVQREECCHAGGSVAWDKDGNLYLSTGDNTNPHGSNGYSPSDERLGRESWDAQKSSANTNDLRGKILRIKPQADGTYTIPEGNLFPKGTPKTRPEIFSMGHRNPFRIAIDQRNGYVYWGDVGPDARESNPERGAEGHDEVGQAKKAGNFGWPHFIGNNKAYNKFDFTTNVSGAKWDAKKPINTSPNNTGLNELPEAKNAFIWYPYANSTEFPLMGNGGRNAMAGPVYYKDDFKKAARPFPAYYDQKLFVYEWMRGFIMSVTLDKNGDFVRMERFLPNMTFNNPMDMEFAPNGDLYMLEYGTGWFTQNDNARLIKIEYNAGNRKPIAEAASSVPGGALPLKVTLSSDGTKDLDDDDLTYNWTVTSDNGFKKEFKTDKVDLTLDRAGIYKAVLTVKDKQGAEASTQLEVTAGNALPEVDINLSGGNKSFFKVGQAIPYTVTVSDKEDGIIGKGITSDEVVFTADYLAEGFDKIAIAQGHKSADESAIAVNAGKKLIEAGDCKSCHAVDKKSVGPSYLEVAKKYEKRPGAIGYLSDKIIKGGSGVWGEIAMAAHPSLAKKDAESMAKYILGLGKANSESKLPLSGNYTPTLPKDDPGKGMFIFRAAYADKGSNGLPSIKSDKTFVLRNATLDVHGFDEEHEVAKMSFNNMRLLLPQKSGGYVVLKGIDLKNVQGVTFLASAPKPQVNAAGGKIEMRIGSPTGALIGESTMLEPSEAMGAPSPLFIPIKANAELESKLQDVYFVFVNPTIKDRTVMVVMSAEVKLGK